MIAVLISLILAALLGFAAYLGTKHPNLLVGRLVTACCVIGSGLVVTIGLLLYPAATGWQAGQVMDIQAAQYDLELIRANEMVKALGSPQAYIEYLKAIKVGE